MAVFNRYTQAPVAQYNPMSFQELAFAPPFIVTGKQIGRAHV